MVVPAAEASRASAASSRATSTKGTASTGGGRAASDAVVTLEVTLTEGELSYGATNDVAELVWFYSSGVERCMRVYATLAPGETWRQPSAPGETRSESDCASSRSRTRCTSSRTIWPICSRCRRLI